MVPARQSISSYNDGSWLSAGGKYQDLVKDLCASDPRLRKRDPKTQVQNVEWPCADSKLVVLELEPSGSFSSPMEKSPLSLKQYLGSTSADPDGCAVYILEGQSPAYIEVLGSHFEMHPSLFSEMERTVVFSDLPYQESDNIVLPSMTAAREHYTLQYFELFILTPDMHDTFVLNCHKTGRHIGVTRTWRGFSRVGTLQIGRAHV